MKFSDIFPGTPAAADLDRLVDDSTQSTVLQWIGKPDVALRLMRSALRSSYLFSQYTMPSYAAHVFGSLTALPPVDDELGRLLAGVTGAVKGELFNNNVFGVPGECHSHYRDMEACYAAASGGESAAASWSGQRAYSEHLRTLLEDRLATFVLVPAVERSTPAFFEAVAANLCKEARFDKYRRFAERHVELDRGEHACVAMEWLAYYVREIRHLDAAAAIKKVAASIKLSKGSGT